MFAAEHHEGVLRIWNGHAANEKVVKTNGFTLAGLKQETQQLKPAKAQIGVEVKEVEKILNEMLQFSSTGIQKQNFPCVR